MHKSRVMRQELCFDLRCSPLIELIIVLLSRSDERKRTVKELLARLARHGVRAAAMECDVGDEYQLCACLERCKREGWPPIRGVIQCAMALNDAVSISKSKFNDAAMCALLTHVSLSQIYETMSRE